MAVGDVLKLDVFFTLQKNPNSYCYNFEVTGIADPSVGDQFDLAKAFDDTFIPGMRNWSDETVIFHCLQVTTVFKADLSVPSVLPTIRDLSDLAGTRTMAVALPGQCSAVVQTFDTPENVTPRTRGRDFITGLVETDQVDGDWTQATATLILGAYEMSLLPTLQGDANGSFEYVNFSRTQQAENIDPQFVSNGGVVPDPPTFGNSPIGAVNNVRLVGLVRTQRQRQAEDVCAVLLGSS